MTTYRIAEVASRSGFPASTLRYYEDIGLIEPPARIASGYRAYDEAALDRLAFIARAKQLGCTLDETTELVGVWQDGRCAPVQERLQVLLADKVGEAQRRIAELATFTAQLQEARAALDAHDPDGPCDDRCACAVAAETAEAAAGPGAAEQVPVVLGAAAAVDPPIACTLDAEAVEDRLAAWQEALVHVARREAIDGGVRLVLEPDAPVGELAALSSAEQGCCRFFSFSLTVDGRGTALEVRAPDGAQDLVTSLFGAPP